MGSFCEWSKLCIELHYLVKNLINLQGMLNRMQQYSERTTTTNDDQGNFVADQYIEQTKDENVLNPKFLSAP